MSVDGRRYKCSKRVTSQTPLLKPESSPEYSVMWNKTGKSAVCAKSLKKI